MQDLTNLVPPTKNQIKGLSTYKPIELKTFSSSYSYSYKELDEKMRNIKSSSARSKTMKQSPSSPGVKSIFEIKQLSLV